MSAKEAVRVRRHHAQMTLGHVYYEAGEYEQALRCYKQAAQPIWFPPDVLRYIARTLAALSDFREASWEYGQAILLTPFARQEDLRQLAACLRQIGDRRAAAVEQLAYEKE